MSKTYKEAAGVEGVLLIYPDLENGRRIPKEEIPEYLKSCGLEPNPHLLSRNWVDCGGKIKVQFRIYHRDENDKIIGHDDYDIHHHDLDIKLLDGVFIEENGNKYIDYDLRETKE